MIRLATLSSTGPIEEDDPLLEHARIDVVGALAPGGLLHHHGHELAVRGHGRPRRMLMVRPLPGAASASSGSLISSSTVTGCSVTFAWPKMKSQTLSSKRGARSCSIARRVALEELDDLALLARKAHRLAHHRLLQLLALDLDLVLRSDVGEDQTQAHAPLGDGAVLGLELVLALARLLDPCRRARSLPGSASRSCRTRDRPCPAAPGSRGPRRGGRAARA